MFARCAIAALGVALAVPATASAANVQAPDSGIVFAAVAGERNSLEITPTSTSGTVRLRDFTAELRAGFGCTTVDANTVDCPTRSRPVTIDLGDVTDRVDVLAPVRVSAGGGDGNDELIADGAGPSQLDGGGGNDTLAGGVAADRLNGGLGGDNLMGDVVRSGGSFVVVSTSAGGNDTLTGGPDADGYAGGPGIDTISWADHAVPITATMPRPIEFGTVEFGTGPDGEQIPQDVEELIGGSGRDTLTGNRGQDRLDGGGNDDTIDGKQGADLVRGGAGGDTIFARDAFADTISCGTNGTSRGSQFNDFLDSDLVDGPPPADCEVATNAAIDEGPNVEIADGALRMRGGRVGVRLSCPAEVEIGCNGRLRLRLLPQGRGAAGAAAPKRYEIEAGESATVRLRLSRGERRKLRRSSRTARITSVETGESGDKTTVQTVRVRRDR